MVISHLTLSLDLERLTRCREVLTRSRELERVRGSYEGAEGVSRRFCVAFGGSAEWAVSRGAGAAGGKRISRRRDRRRCVRRRRRPWRSGTRGVDWSSPCERGWIGFCGNHTFSPRTSRLSEAEIIRGICVIRGVINSHLLEGSHDLLFQAHPPWEKLG